MATTTESGASKRATTRKTTGTSRPRNSGRRSRTSTHTQPKTRVEQAQILAERAVLVPVGASLVARDNLVAGVRDLTSRYGTRTSLERELKRYERRGVTARNRFERRVRKTRTLVEREMRQRRRGVERNFRQNRRRLEREVRLVRRDLEKQSDTLTNRVEKILGEAHGRLSSVA
ncbi:MAG: hypothetical protein ACTHQQ_18725 [Solirubrobacteraceae bacterium]